MHASNAHTTEAQQLLAPLPGKSWLRSLDVLESPPTMFRARGAAERCAELTILGTTMWVRVAWEPDGPGERADLVDQTFELAQVRAIRAEEARERRQQARVVRRIRTARIDLELELEASRAISALAVTRREDAERRYADAERRLITRERVAGVSAIFASVAHDIRSPLTALVWNLRLLEDSDRQGGPLDSNKQGLFDDTRLACELIEGVLDGLRTYASDSGEPRVVAVRPIIESAMRLFRWHMSQRGVHLDYVIEGEPAAWGTPSEICQILLNLLANAAEASPRGGTVALHGSATPSGAIVRVDDDGPGIPSRDAESVFLPFRSTKPDGFGIGLTVARAMARRHDGDLVVVAPRRLGASLELRLASAPATAPSTSGA